MATCAYGPVNGQVFNTAQDLETCAGPVLLDYSDYQQLINASSLLPPLTSSDVTTLALSTLTFWVTCFVFSELRKAS